MNKTSVDDKKILLNNSVEELQKTVAKLGATSKQVGDSELFLHTTIEHLINYIKTLQGAETTAADEAKHQITELGGVIKQYEANNQLAIEKLQNIQQSIMTNKVAIERAIVPTSTQKIALETANKILKKNKTSDPVKDVQEPKEKSPNTQSDIKDRINVINNNSDGKKPTMFDPGVSGGKKSRKYKKSKKTRKSRRR
tara:strand:- start:1022 stop:1612 length:591 start_codon:yes stop_codon:yes gene_type:complete